MKRFLPLLALIVSLALLDRSEAQMLSKRESVLASSSSATATTGNPLSSAKLPNMAGSTTAAKPGTQANTGTPRTTSGSEWFIHRSHQRGSFVGADSTDKLGFVGSEQATEPTTVQSAVTAARIAKHASLIETLAARGKTEIYDPHLLLGFDATTQAAAEKVSSTLARQLSSAPSLHCSRPFSVSLEDRTATIRGEVASERDRELAEQMLLFEPGISEVRNLLTVKSPTKTSPSEDPSYGPSRPSTAPKK